MEFYFCLLDAFKWLFYIFFIIYIACNKSFNCFDNT